MFGVHTKIQCLLDIRTNLVGCNSDFVCNASTNEYHETLCVYQAMW